MFRIDKQSETPIYEQFIEQMELMVLNGIFTEETPLPSVRTLSQSLSINPNTLQKAYAELECRGLCYTVPGMGRMLSKEAKAILLEEQRKNLGKLTELSRRMAIAGVPMEEVLEAVRMAYPKGESK